MTPDLIALVLQQSLPVRLALLDADPNGAGWMVTAPDDWRLYERPSKQERWGIENALCAWLPCNPLAIVEHAARLYADDTHVRADNLGGLWMFALANTGITATDKCPHTAAIALLREVVGG